MSQNTAVAAQDVSPSVVTALPLPKEVPPPTSNSSDPIESLAKKISNHKILFGTILGLILAGAGGQVFLSTLAKKTDVSQVANDVQTVKQEVALLKQAQTRTEATQNRVEHKVDTLLLYLGAPRPTTGRIPQGPEISEPVP